jgi:hypothetical protein
MIPNYQLIKKIEEINDIRNHRFSCVWIFTHINDQLVIIMGHNEKFNNVSSFGGRRDENETVIDTLIRETYEESCRSIQLDRKQIEEKMVITLNRNNEGYIIILYWKDFDFKKIREEMIKQLTEHLNDDEESFKENCNIVAIPFLSIDQNQLDTVKDIENNSFVMRSSERPTLKYLQNNQQIKEKLK